MVAAGRWRRTRSRSAFCDRLGCEIRHAAKLIYATGMDLEKTEGTPIGVNCRVANAKKLQPARRPRSPAP